jgi:hypothetical protein
MGQLGTGIAEPNGKPAIKPQNKKPGPQGPGLLIQPKPTN